MSTQLASYNFPTGQNPLSDGGKFTKPSSLSAMEVQSAQVCCASVAATSCGAIYTGITWPNDQYSEVKIALNNSGNDTLDVVVRSDSTGVNSYQLNFVGPTGISITPKLYRITTGPTFTLLATSSAITFHDGDVIRLSVTGSSITAYQNGVLIPSLSATDSVVTSGSPGFGAFENSGFLQDAGFSLWAGGNSAAVSATQVGAFLVGF